jgi:riboflavin biosynthesis pyrimidine reductase
LPAELERLYGGPFGLREPSLVANFVQTIDGVVAIPEVERSNALIADGSEADRFVVALLRACADVVVLGSGTLLASPNGTWRPERVYPPAAEAFAELRRRRGKPERPAVAVVTAGGSFDAAHPIVAEGAIVLTTQRAAGDLRAAVPEVTEVVALTDGDSVEPAHALAALRERGHGVIVSEAGPTLFGSLLAANAVDELFVTISPLVAGRGAKPRLSLVEGVELLPGTRVEATPLSVRRHGGHVFVRYGLRGRNLV